MHKVNAHGYPFVGVFRVLLRTPEFLEWVKTQYVTSTGYKQRFDMLEVLHEMDANPEYRNQIETYYSETFKLPATKVAMVNFYQNKWSGRYWAEIDGQEIKPDQDDRVISYSSNIEQSYN